MRGPVAPLEQHFLKIVYGLSGLPPAHVLAEEPQDNGFVDGVAASDHVASVVVRFSEERLQVETCEGELTCSSVLQELLLALASK